MRVLLSVVASALLAGCVTTAAEEEHAQCLNYGAAPGSEAYFSCRQMLSNDRLARGQALQNASQYFLQQGQPRTLGGPMVTCTRFGNITTCR